MRLPTLKVYQLLVFLTLLATSSRAQLSINEFMASNGATLADERGEFGDWIEVYNAGAGDVDLAGYYVSDDATKPRKWRIPGGQPARSTVRAGGYLLLWADGDTKLGADHVDFKLGASGEDIVLTAPDGQTTVDRYTFGAQLQDVSFGRTKDGGPTWDFFAMPTPRRANTTPAGAPVAEPVVFSVTGGLYAQPQTVSLASASPKAKIYYTTDGREPGRGDALYTRPIVVATNTPLRAKAFVDPLVPSATTTQTYLFNTEHTFPVVAYTADPFDLFDPAKGMYTNFERDIEITANAELYEPDGTQGFNQRFESEINGTGSAKAPQKSLALKARAKLGKSTIDYRIFPDAERDEYRTLILRNSGQDNNITMFRDVLAQSLVLDVSDVNAGRTLIERPKIYGQDYRPGVTYVNGAYWGILNIRERTDKGYIETHFGLDENEVDFIENANEVREGTIDAWNELQTFLERNDLTTAANFAFVDARVDLDHYIDYVAFNVFIDNQDWPGNNVRRFRERKSGAEWRWLSFDHDFSFGLFVPGQPWNSGSNDANALRRLLRPNGYDWPNPEDATLLFRRLIQNEAWRNRFVNRMADQLNVLYTERRIIGRIDGFEAQYAPEIQQHADRWSEGFLNWDQNVELLRKFARGRADKVRQHFRTELPGIGASVPLTVRISNPAFGEVALSTITVAGPSADFTGQYFTGVPVPLRAYPSRGYVLTDWTGAVTGSAADTEVRLSGPATVTATFGKGSTATAGIVINEINYNSADDRDGGDWVELHNPTAATVDVSGWYFEDESGNFFGLPAKTLLAPGGYLVLAESVSKFRTQFPNVTNVLGDFGDEERGFGLSGGGERITLKNADGTLIDRVEYDDKAPWPTAADGDGPTLQLRSPALDNALGGSWDALAPTPGRLNGSTAAQTQTITFAPLPNVTTATTTITLEASSTSGLPVSFVLVEGPARLSGNVLTLDGTAGRVTVRAQQDGNADFAAAAPVTQSFQVSTAPVTPPTPPTAGYCASDGTQPWLEWIAGVRLGTIYSSSSKDGYRDFTAMSTTLQPGSRQNIELTVGFSYETFDEYLKVWIDFNQNGVFEEGAEAVVARVLSDVRPGTARASILAPVAVPTSAKAGATRMRVALQRGGYPPACGNFALGEVEDYTVVIGGGGAPSTLSVTDCPSDVVRELTAGQSGAAVSWELPTATTTCADGAIQVVQTAGPTPGSVLGIGATTVSYLVSDACGNQSTCSFTVEVKAATPTTPPSACMPTSAFPWHEWIARVRLGSLDNVSWKTPYSDFTGVITPLTRGQTYPVSLTTGFSYYTQNTYFSIYVDYNRDGTLDPASELAYRGTLPAPTDGTPAATLEGVLTVPTWARDGQARMRVVMSPDYDQSPCRDIAFGEIEDYTVLIGSSGAGGGTTARLTMQLGVSVYPNPASAEVTIDLPRDFDLARATVVTANGQTVRTFGGQAAQTRYTMDVSDLAAGVYSVNLLAVDGRSSTHQLIVK